MSPDHKPASPPKNKVDPALDHLISEQRDRLDAEIDRLNSRKRDRFDDDAAAPVTASKPAR